MKVEDLDTRLERLVGEATAEAATPDVRVVLRRGRRRRQRQLTGTALLAAALVAAVLMVPAGVLGAILDRAPADRSEGDRSEGETSTGYPGYWYGKIDASVYLRDNASEQQRAAVRGRIESLSVVDEVFHEPPAEAYAHFAEQFKDRSELLEKIEPEIMPESFRVRLDDPASFGVLEQALCPGEGSADLSSCVPGVDAVIDQNDLFREMLGDYWPDRTDVTVFLAMDADEKQRESVHARLESVPLVEQVFSESPAEAARHASDGIRDAGPGGPTLGLPPSFRVSLRSPATAETAESFLDGFCESRTTGGCAPGVALVTLHPRA